MAAAVPVNTERRDWFRIIRDLNAAGVSMGTIARKTNHQTATVAAWADGGTPKETDARIVLALYSRHCPLKYLEHAKKFEIRLDALDATEGLADSEPPETTPEGP